MRIISLPAAASKSTGQLSSRAERGTWGMGGVAAWGVPPGRPGPSLTLGVTACRPVEHPVTSNSSNASRFISIFLSPREKAHEKTEVAAFARRMCECAISRDLQRVLRRARRHFVFAHEMRLHRFESIDHRAVQLEHDHRRR